jgi:hypothetical protein
LVFAERGILFFLSQPLVETTWRSDEIVAVWNIATFVLIRDCERVEKEPRSGAFVRRFARVADLDASVAPDELAREVTREVNGYMLASVGSWR